MACCVEVPRSRLGLRIFVLTSIAVGFAGCSSDVTRFSDSPFSSPYASRTAAPPETTGSISRQSAAPTGRVESRPLPQTQARALPPPPATNPSATGTAAGAGGIGSYRPSSRSEEVTGSISATRASRPAQAATAPQPAAGQAKVVTVAPGETLAQYSRRYGVSIAALIKANGIASPNDLKIGQRIVIPEGGTAAARAPAASTPTRAPTSTLGPATKSYGGFHVAGPGDTLNKIARRYRVSVVDLAKANNIPPHAQLKLGDRLTIPAKAAPAQPVAATPPPLPAAAPAQKVASAPPRHSANLASPTEPPEADAKQDNGGALFRWPVRGRIVAAFGAKPSGQHNDGINIAVPEGTPVKAAEGGVVAYAGNELKGYGNLILVRHPNGFVTAYAHASELLVKRGDKVTRGQIIAKSGRTGAINAPQLHFEVRKGSTPVDPMPYLGA